MTEEERQEKYAELVKRASDYAYNKSIEGPLKKKIESDNTAIKGLMELLHTDNVTTEAGVMICYSVTKKETLDEEKLISLLHKYAPDTSCIKTKEYIDMDELESEIYHDRLSDEAMMALNDCRIVKEIPTLTIKKPKKGK